MAKLYFRYGAMGSAKTMNLLAVANNYELQGKHVILIKPAIDDRFGADIIKSRTGLCRDADICVAPDTLLDYARFKDIDCILVDECQFLSEFVIHQLRNITVDLDIPVICYGLRTNFKTRLFEGSRRLMELADAIEEVKTTCYFCNRKAVFNIKLKTGGSYTDGAEIELGAEELYRPTCCRCFEERSGIGNPLRNVGHGTGQHPDDRVELWLVRHGQTNENATGILSGHIDASLSPLGIEQARSIGPKLHCVHFDGVYSSTLNRAIHTAELAGYKPTPVDAMREFNFGDYDGRALDSLPKEWVKSLYDFVEDFKSPNGEDIPMVRERISTFLNTLKPGRYLIFCHGGAVRTVGYQLGLNKFIQNGTALIVDWTNREILGTVE